MHKFFSVAALAIVTMALGGCGGSAFSGGSTPGGGTVASVAVTSDTASIPSDGSSGAVITVVAKDANNAVVSGATISFTATNGGNVTATQATTDSTGTAKGSLVVGTATPGASVTVTAAAGTVSATTVVTVANTQKTLSLLTDSPQIPSDGSKKATITAYVRDANNNFVTGQNVAFTTTSGGLAITRGTTDTSGSAVATLDPFNDPTNRTITVTAKAGTATATVMVNVIGTKLTLTGPGSLVLGTAPTTYTVALTDSAGNGIANQTVTLTSALGNVLTPATYTSDSTGQKTFTLTPTASGAETITAAGAGLTATAPVSISDQNFRFTTPDSKTVTTPPKIQLNTPTTVVVTWLQGTTPQANKPVTFVSTRGVPSSFSTVTDGSGTASYTFQSASSGPSVITATGGGVTAQTNLNFVATTPASLALQGSPTTVAVQGQSTLTATVRDAAGNLVQDKTVNFSITQDVTGGTLSVPSAVTDANGQARTVYTASTATSAKDGVVITATVNQTAITGTAKLTVAGQTVFLNLGTGNTINVLDATQYSLPYSVRATDQAGHGVNNVTVTFTVVSLGYMKGKLGFGAPTAGFWDPVTTTVAGDANVFTLFGLNGCVTEDTQNDGNLAHANNYNNDTQIWPGLIVNTDTLNGTTAADGYATVNLVYAKDHAKWVAVRLIATATVSGTESSTSRDLWLPGLAEDYNSPTKQPPGPISPYGTAGTCANPN
ncbi:MAG: beta strand repeat-containing protein [Steroidobacteraceae bacterium]